MNGWISKVRSIEEHLGIPVPLRRATRVALLSAAATTLLGQVVTERASGQGSGTPNQQCHQACINQLAQCQRAVQPARAQCERTAYQTYQSALQACGNNSTCRNTAFNTWITQQQTCTFQARQQEQACGQQFRTCGQNCNQNNQPPPGNTGCREECISELAQCQGAVQPARAQCERAAYQAYLTAFQACGNNSSCRSAAFNTWVTQQQTCTSQARQQAQACDQQYNTCTDECDEENGGQNGQQ